jgi:hypothetical protein
MIDPDLSDIGAIEAGTYNAEILSATPGIAKSSGAPKLQVDFGVDYNGVNKKRSVHLPLKGAGAFGFNSLLRATGFAAYADSLKAKDGVKTGFDETSLIGQHLMVTIESDIYNGEVTDKITGYLPA